MGGGYKEVLAPMHRGTGIYMVGGPLYSNGTLLTFILVNEIARLTNENVNYLGILGYFSYYLKECI